MHITITRPDDNGLTEREWHFTAQALDGQGIVIRLEDYMEGSRPTRRHKMVRKWWRRYFNEQCDLPAPLPGSLPYSVEREVQQRVIESVHIEPLDAL